MENSIKILEKEIKRIQAIIKKAMLSKGDFDRKLELLIGEHYTAIKKLEGTTRVEIYKNTATSIFDYASIPNVWKGNLLD